MQQNQGYKYKEPSYNNATHNIFYFYHQELGTCQGDIHCDQSFSGSGDEFNSIFRIFKFGLGRTRNVGTTLSTIILMQSFSIIIKDFRQQWQNPAYICKIMLQLEVLSNQNCWIISLTITKGIMNELNGIFRIFEFGLGGTRNVGTTLYTTIYMLLWSLSASSSKISGIPGNNDRTQPVSAKPCFNWRSFLTKIVESFHSTEYLPLYKNHYPYKK